MFSRQCEYINAKTGIIPEIALVLGSGLGFLADKVENAVTVPFSEIEGMPVPTTDSHKGNFVIGTLAGKSVVLTDGRIHLYEGYSPEEVIKPIEFMKALGAKTLILTNASGGINKEFNVGDLMIITDHISSFVRSPLIGRNVSDSERFTDMSCVYDKGICNIIKTAGEELNIPVKSGVYVQLTGPQFETPAEIKMLSTLGADAVGMSTVIEAVAAKSLGLKIAGISLITNLACGILDRPLSSEEVIQTAEKKKGDFEKLITETVRKM